MYFICHIEMTSECDFSFIERICNSIPDFHSELETLTVITLIFSVYTLYITFLLSKITAWTAKTLSATYS